MFWWAQNGYTALHQLIERTVSSDRPYNCAIMKALIEYGIHLSVGGDYGVGGLFYNTHSDQKIQDEFHKKWSIFLRDILIDIDKSNCVSQTPLLHAAILSHAPHDILSDIIFNFESVNRKDSKGLYPIDVAIREGLQWKKGMKDLFVAFVEKIKGRDIHVAAKHGLQWANGMPEVIAKDKKWSGIQEKNSGLFPFMLAASGDAGDLDVVYELMKLSPSV